MRSRGDGGLLLLNTPKPEPLCGAYRLSTMKRLALVVLLVALAASACSRTSNEQRELESARERWEAAGLTSYRYQIVMRCFCPPLDAAVEVIDGLVVSARPLSEGATVPQSRAVTIDEMFAMLEQELGSKERGDYTIEYHPDLGYPTRVSADPIEMAVDDEYALEIELEAR